MPRYDPAAIEPKWQAYWEENHSFEVTHDPSKLDIVSLYKRHKGFSVLHPMGYDAFGLPAERHAMRTGEHPRGIGGIAARILCELVAMGGQAHWSVVAAEVWPGVHERHALRRKWDVALMRLRRKLQDTGLRADLVQGDGCGQIGLVLQPGDEMVDLG